MLRYLLILLIPYFFHLYSNPKVTIITSVYKADAFIDFYLEDIKNQTIYSNCEHIIINANSPGNEDLILREFSSKFSNVKYIKLSFDPGLYGVWNIGILMAKGTYLINSNVDDHLKYNALELLSSYLDIHQEIDLVYSDFYETTTPNISFDISASHRLFQKPDFSIDNLKVCCCPGPFPMWRKTLHEHYGLFDHSFKIKGDYEMWLRAGMNGAKFKHLSVPLGVMYTHASCLSHNPRYELLRKQEGKLLYKKYGARG